MRKRSSLASCKGFDICHPKLACKLGRIVSLPQHRAQQGLSLSASPCDASAQRSAELNVVSVSTDFKICSLRRFSFASFQPRSPSVRHNFRFPNTPPLASVFVFVLLILAFSSPYQTFLNPAPAGYLDVHGRSTDPPAGKLSKSAIARPS